MEAEQKRSLSEVAEEEVPNVLIKQEVVWRLEDPHPTDLAYQELKLDMKPLLPIKTEEDVSSTDAGPYAAQPFTSDPQTPADDYEVTKTELTSDEEFMDAKDDSNSGCASQTNDRRFLALADDQRMQAATANNESQSCVKGSDTQPKEICERPYKCEFCARSFRRKYQLKVHLDTHAKDRERKFPCELCGKTFYNKRNLKTHMTHTTHSNEIFKCEICLQTFRRKFYLQVHLNAHAKDRELKFPCQSCKSAFYTKSDLKRHMRGHIGETFNSEVWRAAFKLKDSLDIHMLRQHETANNAQQSQQRSLQLVEEQQKRMEVSVSQSKSDQQPKNNRAETEGAYKCELCPRSFKGRHTLKEHLDTHAEDRQRKFPCQSCEKAFYHKRDLAKHMSTHSGETFNCKVCGASFKLRRTLYRHVLRLHPDESISNEFMLDDGKGSAHYADESQQSTLESVEEQEMKARPSEAYESSTGSLPKENPARKYQCELCLRSFSNSYVLKGHLKTHAEDRQRKFPCQSCEKAFYHKGVLKEHMRTHSGETFKCEVCPRSFRTTAYLKRHLKTHAEDRERNFPCQSCHRAFFTRATLATHMRTHSGETFNCEVCGASFTQKRNLDVHMLRLHKDVFISTELQLDGEKESANDAQPTQQHTLQLVEEPQATLKISVTQSKSHQHPKKSRLDCERAYKCKLCPRSFARNFTLKVHLNSHAKDKERTFLCQLCEKPFYSKKSLKDHIKTHSSKTFNCEVCGASFKQKKSLDLHVLRLHPDEFIRNELMLGGGAESDNYARESQESTLELVEEQEANSSLSVSQSETHELSSDKHTKNTEMRLGTTQPFTNPKEEFVSDDEFIDEQNSSECRKH